MRCEGRDHRVLLHKRIAALIGKLFAPPVVQWNGSPIARLCTATRPVLASPPVVRQTMQSIGNRPHGTFPTNAQLPRPAAASETPAAVSTRRAGFAGHSWMTPEERNSITFKSVRNLTDRVREQLQNFESHGGRAPRGGIGVGHATLALAITQPTSTIGNRAVPSPRVQALLERSRPHPIMTPTARLNASGGPSPLSPPPPAPPMPEASASHHSASLGAARRDSARGILETPRTIRPPEVPEEYKALINELQAALNERRHKVSAAIKQDPPTASVDKHQAPVVPAGAPADSISFNGSLFQRVAKEDANQFVHGMRKALVDLVRASNA